MEVGVTGHNFESWPHKDHSCHVCFKLTGFRGDLNIFSIGSYVKSKSSHGGHLEFPMGKQFTSLVQDHPMIIPAVTIQLAWWFLTRRFLKFQPMRTIYGPWQPYWISNRHQKHKSGRGPSNEHFWQVWLKFVQRFQRRVKCEKLTDGRRTLTHDKCSHGLWPGELKTNKKSELKKINNFFYTPIQKFLIWFIFRYSSFLPICFKIWQIMATKLEINIQIWLSSACSRKS